MRRDSKEDSIKIRRALINQNNEKIQEGEFQHR